MLFNSLQFVIFFPVVTALYFWLPQRYRWMLLLVASCYFYMAFIPAYVTILLFTIIIDYYAGILIEESTDDRRKWCLIMSLVANISVLAVFKYYNFFIDNINGLLGLAQLDSLGYWHILLPIGLSFHTFQAMSYTIEVYRGNQEAERHFGIYALYVMYYPQLVAGPIERPQNVLWQFKVEHRFDYDRAVDGLKMMAYGLFKKVVIADNLAAYVDNYYGHLGTHPTNSAIAMLAFSIQIYCDFSGYSDIALGASKMMGIDLMKNFSYPYFSHSITEFWRKWHISLSTWFRDYLYIPLGGNRQHKYRNVLIVFLVSGFWHGANWTFVIWGGIHGAFQLIEDKFNRKKNSGVLAFLYTNVVVALAWVFFRAPDVKTALQVIANLSIPHFDWPNPLLSSKIVLVTALFMIWEYVISRNGLLAVLNALRPALRYSMYYLIILAILFLGRAGNGQFIYFQF